VIRLALVTHGFVGGGGVPTIARWLRDGLEERGGYTIDIYDLATSRADAASRRIGSPPSWLRPSLRTTLNHPVPHQHWGANAAEIEAMRYRPRRELTETLRGYDLVQVVSGTSAWAYPVVGCGRPVILQVATTAVWERECSRSESGPMLRLWRRQMTRITSRIEAAALQRVDMVLVENDAMLAHVCATGQDRASKVPPGIDTRVFVPAPGGWQRYGPLVSVCRLGDPRKGLGLMVQAYSRLVEQDTRTPPLVLAGRGAIASDVSDSIAKLGLTDRIEVRTNLAPADLIRLYQQASVFLQTSYEEGLGLSVLEAMACGLPVVATATHGTRETVVDGETGWLVDLGTADLASAIAVKARLALDGSGGRAGLQGRERCVTEFSTDACLRRFLEVYEELLQRRRAQIS
jgi:glycosyltransferase involved in cell wall biosynthesis